MSKTKTNTNLVATKDESEFKPTGLYKPTIKCKIGWSIYCKKDIGPDPKNPNLFNGFLDKDLNYFVCNDCKKEFYEGKNGGVFGSQHANKYSEFPVSVPPEPKAKMVKSKSLEKHETIVEPIKDGDFFYNDYSKRLMKVNAVNKACTCPLFKTTKKSKPHIHINATDFLRDIDAYFNHYYENETGEIVHLERDDKLILVKEPIQAVIKYLDGSMWTIVWENCPHKDNIIKSGIKTGYLAENFCKEHGFEFRKSYEPKAKEVKNVATKKEKSTDPTETKSNLSDTMLNGKRGVSDHIISEQIDHPKCWQKMNLFAGEE